MQKDKKPVQKPSISDRRLNIRAGVRAGAKAKGT
jgi:hypothetical protein